MNALLAFFGRLHLILLHLPIGFLVLAGAMAAYAQLKKTSALRPALDLIVGLGALAAIFAAGSGWRLRARCSTQARRSSRQRRRPRSA